MTGELAELYARLEQEGRERGAILHGSFDGIAVVGRNGAVAYCNPGMERLFGCTVEDTPSLAALADNIFPGAEERRTFVSNLEADMAEENPPERVFSFMHKSGVRRWCRLKVSPMGGQRLVINAQDLTEIKVSEERVRHMFYGVIFNESTNTQIASLFPAAGGYSSLLYGKVVDMFYFPIIDTYWPMWMPFVGGEHFIFFSPIFNFADSCISCGIIALIIFYSKYFNASFKQLK